VAGRDAWTNPSQVSRDDARRMAAFLEERARCPDQRQVNDWLMSVLDSRPGERVLEAGCGSGVLCRMAAVVTGPRGRVTGVDVSPDMLEAARECGDGVQYVRASAEALPFSAAAFDAVFAARLLLHVPDPAAVVGEMVRVARPGGRVVVMDWDFESLVVDHPDRDLTRRIIAWRSAHHSGDNWSGRQLYRRMADAGLSDLAVMPVTTVVTDAETSLGQSVFRAAEVACDGGAATVVERDAWMAVLRERVAAGRFFAAITYFIVRGEKV
jgi:ubiquinone/menaquinone biosynthesis C-methylase UbiE